MPYIKPEFIEQLLSEVDIVEVFESTLNQTLKKKGSNHFCKSPFNDEKTASCSVSKSKQIFKDFSSQISGGTVKFLMEYHKCDYPDAIKKIAEIYNKEVVYDESENAKKHIEKLKEKEAVRPILEATHKAYLKCYAELEEKHKAKLEVEGKRQYDKDTIIEWGIGYAPGNKFIYKKCSASGKTKPAEEIGLISTGFMNDKYYDRVIYPIHDKNGLIVGLAGRDISGKKKSAKWINPVDSILYNKSKVWYGLHKAKREIIKTDTAWIVEGYNDVIAWHRIGITNTVASCGTAVTLEQVKALRKLCSKVILCMDGDDAGKKAILKAIPMFLKEDFIVQVHDLIDTDPDDFVRNNPDVIKNENWLEELPYSERTILGFKYLLNEKLNGNELEIVKEARELVRLVVEIKDSATSDYYEEMIAKESGTKKTTINKWKKEIEQEKERKKLDRGNKSELEYYIWPKGLDTKNAEKFLEPIRNYNLFQWNCRIWFYPGLTTFNYISNFEIEIIQHMNDDKFPKKLVRIKNIHGEEKIFDTESNTFNSLQRFTDAITNVGNYQFYGDNGDLKQLTKYLFDQMGVGRMVDVLGWQPDAKAWVWNNSVTVPDKGKKDIDENGVFEHNGTTYYVPSANKIYKSNTHKYLAQKKFKIEGNDISFSKYFETMYKVHREHAISATLFALSSIFQDIISDKQHFFPILFLYGPASSGKSQLAIGCQSLFGQPQAQINLEQGLSTGKANIREFAQFSNSIGILNEYKNGNTEVDGLIKGLWDRQGYKRGTIDSRVATEEVPIISSVIMTGNYFPQSEIVISRIIAEDMLKDSFTSEEKQNFEQLEDILKRGVSSITQEVIQHRRRFEENFTKQFRLAKDHISKTKSLVGMKERYFQNIAVLSATYSILANEFKFPFSSLDVNNHFENLLLAQKVKVEQSSTAVRFWDIFLVAIRGSEQTKLIYRQDYKLEGPFIYFNWTNVYNRIQTEWYSRFQESCPRKMALKKDLQETSAFVQTKSSEPMDTGRGAKNTSCEVFNIKELENYDEILYSIEVQSNKTMEFEFPDNSISSPATPKKNITDNDIEPRLPF